mmetsp:Transcript_65867/g.201705  ORF Transcript_65867/g.201705 Transcript_65867/m.201705 type:complete len:245 (-) Transcript_65867:863-1597(-)
MVSRVLLRRTCKTVQIVKEDDKHKSEHPRHQHDGDSKRQTYLDTSEGPAQVTRAGCVLAHVAHQRAALPEVAREKGQDAHLARGAKAQGERRRARAMAQQACQGLIRVDEYHDRTQRYDHDPVEILEPRLHNPQPSALRHESRGQHREPHAPAHRPFHVQHKVGRQMHGACGPGARVEEHEVDHQDEVDDDSMGHEEGGHAIEAAVNREFSELVPRRFADAGIDDAHVASSALGDCQVSNYKTH